jgi:hypothetical protein
MVMRDEAGRVYIWTYIHGIVLYNVLDKRVGQASESVTPPTSSTSSSVQLNNVIRQHIVINRAN